jgi:hypothetical protein
MTILDNDLVNVIHAERRHQAAHERSIQALVRTQRDSVPTFDAPRVRVAWLRAWMARLAASDARMSS